MAIEIRPAHDFADVTTMLGPRKPTSTVCWCLSHRVDSRTNASLKAADRAAYVEELTRREVAPGVLAHDGAEVVGWAAVAPRADLPFARSRTIPHVDDLPVWSLWCVRVRPGHRGRGIAPVLVDGAAAYALERGAPAVEGYPVDNRGERVDLTMAYVGTMAVFESAGFTKVAETSGVSGGFPRVVVRRFPDRGVFSSRR